MKKPIPVSPSPQRSLWRAFAFASLVLNVLLAVWVWRLSIARPAEAGLSRPAAAAEVAHPGVALAKPRPSGPYAALGSFMAENNRIADLGWTDAQFAAFQDGFRASYEGRGLPLDDDAKRLRDEISQRVQRMVAADEPDPAQEYFRLLREKEGVLRTASGLHYRITEVGSGPHATATDTVVISFAAKTPDGHELTPLNRARVRMSVRDLLPGLAEGVQLLSVGGKALVYLPPNLAFSEANWPPQIPKNMPLAFFLELHEIEPASAQ